MRIFDVDINEPVLIISGAFCFGFITVIVYGILVTLWPHKPSDKPTPPTSDS